VPAHTPVSVVSFVDAHTLASYGPKAQRPFANCASHDCMKPTSAAAADQCCGATVAVSGADASSRTRASGRRRTQAVRIRSSAAAHGDAGVVGLELHSVVCCAPFKTARQRMRRCSTSRVRARTACALCSYLWCARHLCMLRAAQTKVLWVSCKQSPTSARSQT
jgi:hypothetical protein